MKTIEIYSASKEMVRAAVAANRDEIITGTVYFGFTTTEVEPTPASMTQGTWYDTNPSIEEVDGKFQEAFVGQVLVGTGASIVLTEGDYFMWTRVDVGQQSIMKLAGKVKVL